MKIKLYISIKVYRLVELVLGEIFFIVCFLFRIKNLLTYHKFIYKITSKIPATVVFMLLSLYLALFKISFS
jgi:hypothetical protein